MKITVDLSKHGIPPIHIPFLVAAFLWKMIETKGQTGDLLLMEVEKGVPEDIEVLKKEGIIAELVN